MMRSRSAWIGAVILLLVLIAAGLGSWLAPYAPNAQVLSDQLLAPSSTHLMGTDQFGRDIWSRVLAGTRIALLTGLIADGIALLLGTLLGLTAAYWGGWADSLIMRSMDVILAFPYLLLAMMVMAILGPGLYQAMSAIGIVYVPQFARLVRSAALEVKAQSFVEAAAALGASDGRIIARHIFVNVTPPIIVQATLTFGTAIVEAAGLGFLGLGAQPPTPEWGAMLADGRSYVLSAWWMATFPGLAIMVTVLGFNLLGDALRDALDPRMRGTYR